MEIIDIYTGGYTDSIFIISEYIYTYYLDGNHRTKTVAVDTTTYTYDNLNRLKTATLHDGTEQVYEFDSNSNRSKLTIFKDYRTSVTTYTYDLNDRIISENKYNLYDIDEPNEYGRITHYTYDNNGNMINNSGGVTQTFDLLNRMTSYDNGATTAIYTYNPDNMRSSKSVNAITTTHVWVGTDIALDITSRGRACPSRNLQMFTISHNCNYVIIRG